MNKKRARHTLDRKGQIREHSEAASSLVLVREQARIQTGLSGLCKPVRSFRDRVHPK